MRFPSFLISSAGLVLIFLCGIGCAPTAEERLAREGPVFGRSEVSYVLGSEGRIELDEATEVAKTIGRYRRLNYSEAEKIRALAQEKFDGFVAREIEILRKEKTFTAKRKAIEKKAQKRTQTKPTAAIEIQEEATREILKLEEELRTKAVIAVRRRYGSQIAVRVHAKDNQPAVAITEIRDGTVVRPATILQLDREPGSTVEHEGRPTAVVDPSLP